MIHCRYNLPKRERILKRMGFLLVQEKGNRFVTETLVILHLQNGLDYHRLGITASRRVGNAVVRNRLKRWVREAFRRQKGKGSGGKDIVVVVRKSAVKGGYQKVRRDLETFFSRRTTRTEKKRRRR